ncbi:phosphatase PAP2 family protein [Frigidibacter oleivorans]|uniref:phosphatase PAP2 family protein n=1 Tax=Frigidibacter oleivorans TaxID=2487129 RepID=UPI0013DECC84|nr:phosphatase PAP2 family protein [Frigidibacter oleivorans]
MLLAAALMQARDGIVDGGPLPLSPPGAVTLDPVGRLLRLDASLRRAILEAELLADLDYEVEPAGLAASAITVLRREAGAAPRSASYVPLLRIARPTDAQFAEQVQLVAAYADLRLDRMAEIQIQTGDIVSFFAGILRMEQPRMKRTGLVLGLALDIATAVSQRAKLALAAPRPYQFSTSLQPAIPGPVHASYPSGHATQAFTVATVLSILSGAGGEPAADSQLFRMAARIAANRTVAGVHYPVDSAAGAVIGIAVGGYLAARAQASGAAEAFEFHGGAWDLAPGPRDFHLAELLAALAGDGTIDRSAGGAVLQAPLFAGIWAEAVKEWGETWS